MSKTIRWGILGTGTIAAMFAEALRLLPDAELAAVGSRSREGAEAFARDHGARRAHGSYEDLARDPDVDVVYVATPNTAHKDNCLLCFEHGKAVLCEKPFAIDAAEGRAIADAARARGLFCMEGMWMRFAPIMGELRSLLRGGAIGDVRMVTAQLGAPFAFDPKARVFDPALGGGALLDLGVYPLSFAFHLLGRPTAVASQAVLGETGVDEQTTILLTFPEGRQAALTTSLRSRTANDATIVGTGGMIRLHEPLYFPERLSLVRTAKAHGGGGARSRPGPLRRVKQLPLARDVRDLVARARTRTVTRRALGHGHAHEAIEVMRCLREGARESPIMPLDETLAILQTIDTIRREWRRAQSPASERPACERRD